MNYLTFFEVKTLFNKLWLSFDKRAELDLRSTKYFNTFETSNLDLDEYTFH